VNTGVVSDQSSLLNPRMSSWSCGQFARKLAAML
jgi:hypothetical protein